MIYIYMFRFFLSLSLGDGFGVLESHRLSTDGPTELLEKVIELGSLHDINIEITKQNVHQCFPNANGRWFRRRNNDGALNRVPPHFFPHIWSILDSSKGLCIKHHELPRDPIVLEKTPEEFNFALAVESFLGWFADPAERQIAVEVLTILYQHQQQGKQMGRMLDLPLIIDHATRDFWNKWSQLSSTSLEKSALFKEGLEYKANVDLARRLFFDLPLEGTESTYTYLNKSVLELLK